MKIEYTTRTGVTLKQVALYDLFPKDDWKYDAPDMPYKEWVLKIAEEADGWGLLDEAEN